MSVLAVIPARAGSKGIVGKNLRMLHGKPLIAHTIEAARRAACVGRVIVSTDGEEIARVAREHGAEVPFLRPAALATDDASTVDVVAHLLEHLTRDEGSEVPALVVLQPTSPLRTADDVDAAYALWTSSGADACVSVTAADKHPAWMVHVDAHARMRFFLGRDDVALRRQALEPLHVLNGAIYFARAHVVLRGRTLLPDDCVAYQMNKSRSIDIDDEVDLVYAAALFAREASA